MTKVVANTNGSVPKRRRRGSKMEFVEDDYPPSQMPDVPTKTVRHFNRFGEDERFAESEQYLFDSVFMPVYANVIKMLDERYHPFDLKWDDFSRRVMCRGKRIQDADIREIAEWVQRRKCVAPVHIVRDAINRVAEKRPFHQVKDYLHALKWDGTPRADTLLIDLADATDSQLTRVITGKWLIQAIARIYEPGCQADATLVLEGPQGYRKSTFLRTLCGVAWFKDDLPSLESKDAVMHLQGTWILELAELATLSKSETATIKRFLTTRSDNIRVPYGHVTNEYPRTCVFAGTVNPGGSGYLKDETGGRRFWPIEVRKVIDAAAVEAVRDQVWAEAVHRYKAGEQWFVTDAALLQELQEAQADRYIGDPWLEIIREFVEGEDHITLNRLFRVGLSLGDHGKWSQGEAVRVAKILSHLGWKRIQVRVPGGTTRESRYVPINGTRNFPKLDDPSLSPDPQKASLLGEADTTVQGFKKLLES